jgi:hypothetical protein
LCSQPDDDLQPNSVVYNTEVVFDDGRLGCVQVVAPANPKVMVCAARAAIFEDVLGAGLLELACTSSGDAVLGEYRLFCGGVEYVIDVVKDKDNELE